MAKRNSSIVLGSFSKREARAQFAALCFRTKKKGHTEVLLVTSRRSGRWVLPKGWPIEGLTPVQSALREAFEEAGVQGKPLDQCVGHYWYRKALSEKAMLPCIVSVFPVQVRELSATFPEFAERRRMWFSQKNAAARVDEPALKQILRQFDPTRLRSAKAA